MTYEAFMEKHRDEVVIFESYYKYDFTFVPKNPDSKIDYISVGGCSDDIYKLSVGAGEEFQIGSLEPDSVKFKNGDYHNFNW